MCLLQGYQIPPPSGYKKCVGLDGPIITGVLLSVQQVGGNLLQFDALASTFMMFHKIELR